MQFFEVLGQVNFSLFVHPMNFIQMRFLPLSRGLVIHPAVSDWNSRLNLL